GPAGVPAVDAIWRQVGVLDALARALLGEGDVFHLHRGGAGPPLELEPAALAAAGHEELGFVEVGAEDGASLDARYAFREIAAGAGVADVEVGQRRARTTQRVERHAPRRRRAGVHALLAGVDDGVAAVGREHAVLVADELTERVAVQHPAPGAARREQRRGGGSVGEVQILRTGVLVERERHLEL